MFTVKHIQSDGTHGPRIENLYSGERITVCPENDGLGALEVRTGDVFIAGLWGGIAYVMNADGKTVARYDLPYQKSASCVIGGQGSVG